MGGQEGKRGAMGAGKVTKNEAVDLEHGTSNGRGSQLRTKSTILSKSKRLFIH